MPEVQEKLLKTINSKLSALVTEAKKSEPETWVKASVITSLTGWDCQKMRQARDYNYVKFKKVDGKFWYLLESVSSFWHKKVIQ